MTGQTKTRRCDLPRFDDPRMETPGPGAYNPVVKNVAAFAPKFTISEVYVKKGKFPTDPKDPKRRFEIPGPNFYVPPGSLDEILTHKKGTSVYTKFPEVKQRFQTPSCQKYLPVRPKDGTSPSLASRTDYPGSPQWEIKTKAKNNQSPDKYQIKSAIGNSGHTFSIRCKSPEPKQKKNETPGPGEYSNIDAGLHCIQPSSPQFSLSGRFEDAGEKFLKRTASPLGPGHYPLKSTIRTDIGCTIGARIEHRGCNQFNVM